MASNLATGKTPLAPWSSGHSINVNVNVNARSMQPYVDVP